MQKLKQILTRVIDWCKRHPILSSIVGFWLAGMCYIINWPPMPWQPLAWEVWKYVYSHPLEWSQNWDHPDKLKRDAAVNAIVAKYVAPGMHYTKVIRIMEANKYKCYYEPYKSEMDIEDYRLFCAMPWPIDVFNEDKMPLSGLAGTGVHSMFTLDIQSNNVQYFNSSADS
jgi:hypothetical protein